MKKNMCTQKLSILGNTVVQFLIHFLRLRCRFIVTYQACFLFYLFFFFWINVYFYTKPKIQDYYFNIVITAMIIISDVTKQQHWRSECWMSLVCVQIFYFSGVVWAFYCQNKKNAKPKKKIDICTLRVLSLNMSLKMGLANLMSKTLLFLLQFMMEANAM